MQVSRLLAAVAAAVLALAGCGGDDDEPDEYSAALATSLSEDSDLPYEQSEVDCLAIEFVEAIGGAEELESAGITPEDLRESEDLSDLGLAPEDVDTDAVADAFGDCDVLLSDVILLEAGDEVPPDVRECVADTLDEEELADFFAAKIVGGEVSGGEASGAGELPQAIVQSLLECY